VSPRRHHHGAKGGAAQRSPTGSRDEGESGGAAGQGAEDRAPSAAEAEQNERQPQQQEQHQAGLPPQQQARAEAVSPAGGALDPLPPSAAHVAPTTAPAGAALGPALSAPAAAAAAAPAAGAGGEELLPPGSFARLRAAAHRVGTVEGHVTRLAGLLQEAHAALGLLMPAGARGTGSGSGGGVPSGAQAPLVSDLERQLVATMSEVLVDVEGELRAAGAALRAARGEMGAALGGGGGGGAGGGGGGGGGAAEPPAGGAV
jgi:hypothetical protein